MEQPVDKSLIQKFIDGSCTPGEMELVRKFLADKGSDQFFEEILNERWAKGGQDALYDEAQMLRWQARFNQKVAEISPEPARPFRLPSYFKYAAVFAGIVLATFGWYQLQKSNATVAVAMLESRTAAGKLLKIQLPDGTTVYLNAASKLRYPEKFTGSTRTVKLEGEAFFEVNPDEAHPFMVAADKLNVQVLGTSFNVRSYHNDETLAVTVATGKVGVTVAGNTTASILLPDHELVYSRRSGELTVNTVNAADSKAWETGSFVFNYETLENITKRLSRWYDVEFVFADASLLHKRFKLKLKNEQLTTVLQALSMAGEGFRYEIKGKQVIIKPKNT